MRLLYVDIYGQFLNPTRNLLPALLKCVGDVRFFGPGYVPGAEIAKGLGAYCATHGPFDLVLTNTHFLFCDVYGLDKNPRAFRNSYDIPCPDEDLSIVGRALADLGEMENVCALLFENDLYHAKLQEIEALDDRARYVVGLGEDFFLDEGQVMAATGERFSDQVTPHWARFIRTQRHRIASLPAFIGEHEFCWTPLANRPKAWDVPGVGYRARQIAVDTLRRGGYMTSKRSLMLRAEALAWRMGILDRASRFRQAIINKRFQIQLETARHVFTCGSRIRMPIRKFFEVPAAGALLVCEPFVGFEKAGFVHGVNAIVAAPEDLLDVDAELRRDPDHTQALACAGRELVWERHSLHARAGQLRDTFRAMIENRFSGAGWTGGCYEVRAEPKDAVTAR